MRRIVSAPRSIVPGKRPHEANKFVQIACSQPCHIVAREYRTCAEEILLPLDERAHLAALPLFEEQVFHDAHSREELQGGAE